VVISSEMPEIIGICHRVVVMREGQITGVLTGDHINENEIMRYAAGLKREDSIDHDERIGKQRAPTRKAQGGIAGYQDAGSGNGSAPAVRDRLSAESGLCE
jgi:ABC-type dipeptide/oligopeptide/nickel transport system ATPase component